MSDMSKSVLSLPVAASNPAAPRLSSLLNFAAVRGARNSAKSASNDEGHDVIVARHHASIGEIDEAEWNRLFTDASENWGYFRGVERAGSQHFSYSAVAAYKDGRLIAAAPVFRLDYRLDMTLPAGAKLLGDWLAERAPRLVKVPVLGLGSPMTEECPIGLDASLDQRERAIAFAALTRALEERAKAEKIRFIALKDITDCDAQWADAPLAGSGFAHMASLPVATLPLPYASFDDYLGSMPSKKRTDIRKKLKAASDIDVEFCDDIENVYDEILALYQATRANRKASYEAFDEIPENYFREVIATSGGKAKVALFRLDGRIVCFSFFLIEKDKLIGKFLGMDYTVARARNLYFLNWMTIVRFCIEKGISHFQAGQTTYAVKVRLGCKLKHSWIYFKHTGPVLGPLVRRLGRKLSLGAVDPELGTLGDKAIYLTPAQQ
jgi:predicted N-acyltransferase